MSNLNSEVANLLEKQRSACQAAIGGKSNAAKGYRKQVAAAPIVTIPDMSQYLPAPIIQTVTETVEVVKEVGVSNAIAVGATIIGFCIGMGLGVAFF